jgi:hypothetical protein
MSTWPWAELSDCPQCLSAAERAIIENPDLQANLIAALRQYEAGERVSSDWLFDEEERICGCGNSRCTFNVRIVRRSA